MPRLFFGFLCAGLLLAGGELLQRPAPGEPARRWPGPLAWTLLLAALVPVLGGERGALRRYQAMLSDIPAGLRGADAGLLQGRELARRIQEAVPPGAILLVRVDRPYLFDFRRNPVWVLDQPGAASPPPGLPYRQGGEALARYLAGQGVRYVAYSYRTGVFYPPGSRAQRNLDRPAPWFRPFHEFAFAVHEDLGELGRTRERLYDDGWSFVVDLERVKGGAAAARPSP